MMPLKYSTKNRRWNNRPSAEFVELNLTVKTKGRIEGHEGLEIGIGRLSGLTSGFVNLIWPTLILSFGPPAEPVFWIVFYNTGGSPFSGLSLWSSYRFPALIVPSKIGGCRWRGKRREPVGRLEFPTPPANGGVRSWGEGSCLQDRKRDRTANTPLPFVNFPATAETRTDSIPSNPG